MPTHIITVERIYSTTIKIEAADQGSAEARFDELMLTDDFRQEIARKELEQMDTSGFKAFSDGAVDSFYDEG